MLGALVLLAAITAVAVRRRGRRPYLIAGWLWFLGTLVPVIGLVQVGGQAMADRYTTSLPSVSSWRWFSASRISRTRGASGASPSRWCRRCRLLLLATLTTLQISRWRDSKTLFDTPYRSPRITVIVQNNLGSSGSAGKIRSSDSTFSEALRIKPDFFDALVNMGVALLNRARRRRPFPITIAPLG